MAIASRAHDLCPIEARTLDGPTRGRLIKFSKIKLSGNALERNTETYEYEAKRRKQKTIWGP